MYERTSGVPEHSGVGVNKGRSGVARKRTGLGAFAPTATQGGGAGLHTALGYPRVCSGSWACSASALVEPDVDGPLGENSRK